jgi:predicted Zn-dependent peptidase
MKLVFVRRDAVPVVNVRVQFAGGYTTDSVSGKLGLASFATAMMDDGAGGRDQFELAEEIERLGAGLSVGAGLDTASVSVSALSDKLSPSLALFMDVLTRPDFPAEEIPRLKSRWLANIEQEKAQPNSLANRMLPPVMFGAGHPYAIPFTGTGTPDVIRGLTREDLVNWHQSWIRPELGTVFVVGDTTLSEITTELNATLGQWKPEGVSPPLPTVADVALPTAPRVILVDKPNSPQSLIFAGHVGPRGTAENDTAITAMNDVLGGQFTARINMNLREAKGWAYGAGTGMPGVKETIPLLVYAPVQTDKTGESIIAARQDIKDFLTSKGTTQAERDQTINGQILSLPGSFETSSDLLSAMMRNNLLGRPDDYYATLPATYRAITAAQMDQAAREAINPDRLIWVVVGDAKLVKPQLDAVGLPVEMGTLAD